MLQQRPPIKNNYTYIKLNKQNRYHSLNVEKRSILDCPTVWADKYIWEAYRHIYIFVGVKKCVYRSLYQPSRHCVKRIVVDSPIRVHLACIGGCSLYLTNGYVPSGNNETWRMFPTETARPIHTHIAWNQRKKDEEEKKETWRTSNKNGIPYSLREDLWDQIDEQEEGRERESEHIQI